MTGDIDMSLAHDLTEGPREVWEGLDDFVDDFEEGGMGTPSPIVSPADMNRIFRGVEFHTSAGGEVFDGMTIQGGKYDVEVCKKIQERYGDGQSRNNPLLKKNDMRRIMRIPIGVVEHHLKYGPDQFDPRNFNEDDIKRVMASDTEVAKAVRVDKY